MATVAVANPPRRGSVSRGVVGITNVRSADRQSRSIDCEDGVAVLGMLDDLGAAHPLSVNSWGDFHRKLAEAEADEIAGRVYTTEEVFNSLRRKVMTGQWDDE